jgi:beta-1,4-mannosyl-glycoprotein beta-1,4-N-acetylglucosaminyltransferase
MIFDCFTYNNEDLILELRLNTLDKFVDKFVIIEATTDHAGKNKELNFDISKFKSFEKKIRYIIVDDMPKNTKSFYYNKRFWHKNIVRDEYQRNQIVRGLFDAKDDDLILISDIDEIPNLRNINQINFKKYAVFNQKFYKFKLNLLAPSQTPYQGSRVIKKKYLKGRITPQWVRNQYTRRIKFWQVHRYFTNPTFIEEGGWHFSFMVKPEDMKNKMELYAHGELNIEKFKDASYVKERVTKGKDIFSDGSLEKVEIDETFPEYILKNKKKFKEFII